MTLTAREMARRSSSSGSIDYDSLRGRYGPLIDPPKGPDDLMLQRRALLSLHAAGVPLSAILAGSYRSNAQQTALYAKDPDRYAAPSYSLHEYGLAIDVNSALADKYRQALLNAGWYQERADEPWHFSYGVFNPGDVTQPPSRNPSRPTNRRTRERPRPRPRVRQQI